MNDDAINDLFHALLRRKASDVEHLRLYAMRDSLPKSMRESPSVMMQLILQHDHEHRMVKIANDIEERATKVAKAAFKTTGEDCKREFVTSVSVVAEAVLRKTAEKAQRHTLAPGGNCWEEHATRLVFLGSGAVLALIIEHILIR